MTTRDVEGFPGGSVVKNLPANTGDMDSILGLGRSPGEGHGNPFQYSCLENPMDREVWKSIVHRVAKSQTQLSMRTHILHRVPEVHLELMNTHKHSEGKLNFSVPNTDVLQHDFCH